MGPEERAAGCLGVAWAVIALALAVGGAWAWAVGGVSPRVGWVWFASTAVAFVGAVVFFRASIDAGEDGR